MKRMVLLGLLLLLLSGISYGQGCAVCTKVAAGMDSKSAKGLNGGIVYLAFLPLAIMGTLGYVWWRSQKTPNP
jgi:hypothetical protein